MNHEATNRRKPTCRHVFEIRTPEIQATTSYAREDKPQEERSNIYEHISYVLTDCVVTSLTDINERAYGISQSEACLLK
jgi:hypothetical protein